MRGRERNTVKQLQGEQPIKAAVTETVLQHKKHTLTGASGCGFLGIICGVFLV